MKEVRELTGISQQQLADYLGVKRTQVAAAEIGSRDLPDAANLEALNMYLILQEPKETAQLQTENASQTVTLHKKLLKRIKQCTAQIDIARIELENMQAQYKQCGNALYMVNELLVRLPDDEAHETNRLVLQIIERKAMEKLKTCGVEVQGLLQLDIDAWEFEKGKAEGML